MVFVQSLLGLALAATTVQAVPHHRGSMRSANNVPQGAQASNAMAGNEYPSAGGAAQSSGASMQASNGGAQQAGDSTPKAVYFMSNEEENSIVALKVGQDGTLSDGSITPTGGCGSVQVDPMTGEPTVPDALASQGSVRVAGDMIFAVNAGSNTVSMLKMDPNDPTQLTMVGQPASTNGEFPVSMAVSMKNNLVCVGNTGAQAGVSCGPFDAQNGIGQMDELRPFDLGQSTPPTGPLNNVATTFFNGDETMLFTTVKGDPMVNNTGFLSAFAVQGGQVSSEETRSSPNGTAVLFGTNAIPGTNNLLATDASFGAAILSTDQAGQAEVQTRSEVENQKATCWVTISEMTGTAFLTDVGVNHLLEMDIQTGEITAMNLTSVGNNNPGMIDIDAKGSFMYSLSPGNENVSSAVTVFDLTGGSGQVQMIQNFEPSGVSSLAMGMAVLL